MLVTGSALLQGVSWTSGTEDRGSEGAGPETSALSCKSVSTTNGHGQVGVAGSCVSTKPLSNTDAATMVTPELAVVQSTLFRRRSYAGQGVTMLSESMYHVARLQVAETSIASKSQEGAQGGYIPESSETKPQAENANYFPLAAAYPQLFCN